MTVIYDKARTGQRINHKGKWLFLTGYFNDGYWQAQDHNQGLIWVKNDTIKPDYKLKEVTI